MAALGRGFSVPTGPQATCGHNRSCVTHSCATDGANDNRHRPEDTPQGRVVTAETATFAAPAARAERTAQFRVVAGWLWSGALLAVLAFLVIYPVAMLLLGRADQHQSGGGRVRRIRPVARQLHHRPGQPERAPRARQLADRLRRRHRVWRSSIGLTFSWIVVRTNTPCKGFIAGRQHDPAVRAAAGRRASPGRSSARRKHRPAQHRARKWAGIDWRFDVYSMAGLIVRLRHLLRALRLHVHRLGAAQHGPDASRRPPRSPAPARSAPCSPSPSR